MTLSNLMSALEFDATVELEKKTKKKKNLRERKIDISILINSLKDEFVSIFYQPSKRIRNKVINRITIRLTKSLVDIVPGRHFDRKPSHASKPNNYSKKILS